VLDLVYVLATIAFFALSMGYIGGCASLGRADGAVDEEHTT